MIRISDNPVVHRIKLTLVESVTQPAMRCFSRKRLSGVLCLQSGPSTPGTHRATVLVSVAPDLPDQYLSVNQWQRFPCWIATSHIKPHTTRR
jgi:hypothetical protein